MVHLMPLGTNDPVYLEAKKRFVAGWQHPDKTYHLEAIYYIVQDGAEAQAHLARNRAYLQAVKARVGDGAEQYLFHGTRRACHIGDDNNNLYPCNNPDCFFCSIMKCSFSLAHVGAHEMFGKGIYTSSVSSKADGYVWNWHMHSHKHTMFLSNVVTGRVEPLLVPQPNRTAPDAGFDSTEGVTKPQGGSVEYPETIVYREDAILPSVVVVYTRQHK
ncbi:ADP-ribosylation [Obba rivulosa]|uniref:Poly [ADP-ribose] polymerase n=1 Tax=Obba rivulosa TaxID=1052685 RepID=A0A8E2AI94_9APHY|nr:ADP-ribosylation [Obba rivulosa]